MAYTLKRLQTIWLFIAVTLAQAPKDPLKDLCRRYGHQTTVIDRTLYIDGGWIYADPLEQNPIPTMSTHQSQTHGDQKLTLPQIRGSYTAI